MRLTEIAQAPAHKGNKGNKGNSAAIRVHEGIEKGRIHNVNGSDGSLHAPQHVHGKGRHHHDGKEHHDALNEISPAHSHKAAGQSVEYHHKGTNQHCRSIVQPEKGAEQLAAADEAGACIDNKENNDKDCRNNPQQIAVVIVAVLEKVRQRQGVVCHLRIAAQPLCHKVPVCPGAKAQAHRNPCRAETCQVCCSRHTHHHPAAHVRGLGTHGRNPGSQLAVADDIIIHAVCLAVVINADCHHQCQINDKCANYQDIIQCYSSYKK